MGLSHYTHSHDCFSAQKLPYSPSPSFLCFALQGSFLGGLNLGLCTAGLYTAPSVDVTITASLCIMLGAQHVSFIFYIWLV